MKVTHLFFDLYGILIDGAKPCYAAQLGQVMATRYGGQPEVWENAHRQIALDWDSYYADLDLSQGIDQVYEGLYRTTRALFRLTGTPEPAHESLIALSRELPGLVTQHCDGLYPDVKAVIESLYQQGYILGITTTHALYAQAVGLLTGGGIRDCFQGVIVGVDTLDKYERDEAYFMNAARMSSTAPEHCLIVDDVPAYLAAARRIGMHTVLIDRKSKYKSVSDLSRCTDLTELPRLLTAD
jgi:HAD superfamily hydrolase (TIGR01509 family)